MPAPSSTTSKLDVPHASPPPSSQLSQKQRGPSSSVLLRIITVAIAFVLAFHWYLVLHHVNYHAPTSLLQHEIERMGSFLESSSGIGGLGKMRRKKGYVLSPVCGGCYRAFDGDGTPCYDLIQQYMTQHNGASLHDASRSVGGDVKECGICNPDTCYERYHSKNGGGKGGSSSLEQHRTRYWRYWRFDRTAPKFSNPTSLVLPSIPEHMRVPPSAFPDDEIESYIRKVYAHPDPENTTNVFLNEYNPGLAAIPESQKPYLPWNAKYALSMRVTPHNLCWGPWLTDALSEDIKQTMHSLNYLGLALLDENYKTIPGYDVVIDIDKQLDARRDNFMGEPAFVDYRLFTMNDELYLNVNADTVILTRLDFHSKGGLFMEDEDSEFARMWNASPRRKHRAEDDPLRLTNLYGGDLLEVTLQHPFNTVWGEGRDAIYGKNYALFSLPNATHPDAPDSIYAEMSVYPEHRVQQLLPEEYEKLPKDHRIKWRQRRNFKIDGIMQRRMAKVGNATVSDSTRFGARVPSFFNADEVWFPGVKNPFKEFTHGGACCVSLSAAQIKSAGGGGLIELNLGLDSLLVGVGHTLVKWAKKKSLPPSERMLVPDTNYVSFFYAFDPRPPFNLLVRSGYFCLGHASSTDSAQEGGTLNPRSILTQNRPLRQNNETFACPQIHYVETIIEKVGDPERVVIGYGINDCTARLVEVEKGEIARLLFPDPTDMAISSFSDSS